MQGDDLAEPLGGVVASSSRPGAEGLLAAALDAFYEIGYGGTSVRTIAVQANVTVAALYHHFSSKNDILLTIMQQVMNSVLADARAALDDAGTDPVDRFRAIIGAQVRYHTSHQKEAFVANSELRSLEPVARTLVVGLRDEHENMFLQAITDGVRSGDFHVPDPEQATRAVLAMCTAVSSWFRPGGGPLSAADVERDYVLLALNTVGYFHDRPLAGTGR